MSAEGVVGDLCAAIGVGPQSLPFRLRFERSGDVHIEQRDGFVVVYVTRTVPQYRQGVAAAALRLVHPDRALPYPVRAAFRGDETLVLLARLPENRVELPTLDGLIQTLIRLADEAEAAG